MSAEEIARAAMNIAASMCIYTNDRILVYTLDQDSAGNVVVDEASAAERPAPITSDEREARRTAPVAGRSS